MEQGLRDAVLGAGQVQAPASPYSDIAALYAPEFQAMQSEAGGQAIVGGAQAQKEAATRAAAQKKEREADLSDPSKYRVVKKEDGGFDFFAPDGSQVDIATLSSRTSTKPSDWIKDSENPIDIQYMNDYANLQDYVSAVLSKDKKKVDEYRAGSPQLSQYDDRGGIDRLIEQFQKSYNRYYVPSKWGESPGGPVVPTRQTGTSFGLGDTGGI